MHAQPALTDDLSPLMKQYSELKREAGDALLLFRMGDFYELFGEDAVTASRILEITLTSRDRNKPNPLPMAGVPHHSVQGYLQRLLQAGYKVAIGEQVGEPSAKAIVRREITRVFTPAVQFDLEGSESAYLVTAVRAEEARPGTQPLWTLACLEPATGEVRVSTPLGEPELLDELLALPVRHLLRLEDHLPEDPCARFQAEAPHALVERLPANYLSAERAAEVVRANYGIENLDSLFGTGREAHAVGVLIHYALRTQQQSRLEHLAPPAPLHAPDALVYGPRTAEHLDLLPSPAGGPNLFQFINRSRSALGARRLKRWLLEPLRDADEILLRQTAVRELSQDLPSQQALAAKLGEAYDLERILGRVATRLANPRDLLALARTLATLEPLAATLEAARSPALTQLRGELREANAEVSALCLTLLRTLREDAPLTSRDAGIFNPGADPELDRLITLTEEGQRWLVELEAREKEATGIPSLKVRYNRVFGYYIEVTKANLRAVPERYQRKQSMVNAERFFTEELKKFEDEIVTADSRRRALEQRLFEGVIDSVRELHASISRSARLLGELDALSALARLGAQPGWVFPAIDDSLDLEIEGGRHPLVDQNAGGRFVPNDLSLNPESRRVLLITGPNMGGKSTVMRQSALIVILGQMGAPVPAARARWGAVSSVFTRIGAHDSIARGQSTFMVEMGELAHILSRADERSLILLDEIGRGTSTYDGISVACATMEWICRKVRARTLFATHYHELTRLDSQFRVLKNAHMAVEGAKALQGGNLRFLYKLREGPANESFGIHVARLAGLPSPLIERAWKILAELERGSTQNALLSAAVERSVDQLSFFDLPAAAAGPVEADPTGQSFLTGFAATMAEPPPAPEPPAPHPVLIELRGIDPNALTPIQALTLLAELKSRAGEDARKL
ncbi:MAG: DNA mismatch repair protein MutS [Bdellovibrionales bacterium]|nr:DNA mismatch repair protein MutS [Bdellovibrionales bacterium]